MSAPGRRPRGFGRGHGGARPYAPAPTNWAGRYECAVHNLPSARTIAPSGDGPGQLAGNPSRRKSGVHSDCERGLPSLPLGSRARVRKGDPRTGATGGSGGERICEAGRRLRRAASGTRARSANESKETRTGRGIYPSPGTKLGPRKTGLFYPGIHSTLGRVAVHKDSQ